MSRVVNYRLNLYITQHIGWETRSAWIQQTAPSLTLCCRLMFNSIANYSHHLLSFCLPYLKMLQRAANISPCLHGIWVPGMWRHISKHNSVYAQPREERVRQYQGVWRAGTLELAPYLFLPGDHSRFDGSNPSWTSYSRASNFEQLHVPGLSITSTSLRAPTLSTDTWPHLPHPHSR